MPVMRSGPIVTETKGLQLGDMRRPVGLLFCAPRHIQVGSGCSQARMPAESNVSEVSATAIQNGVNMDFSKLKLLEVLQLKNCHRKKNCYS